MTQVAILGPGMIDFQILVSRCGSIEGPRAEFEKLVTDIVALEHPEVRQIAASPGDWGIDAFVGDMDGGNVSVWQAKFYLGNVPIGRKSDIVAAYESARDSAKKHGYTLTQWTLCVASPLVPTMSKWWQKFVKDTAKADKVAMELWDDGQLRRRLSRPGPGAQALRDQYFNPIFTVPDAVPSTPVPIPWEDLDDDAGYDRSLFVHQLRAGNLTETRSAREAFFNAEILEAEIADKAVQRETDALKAWRSRIRATWESKFNDATSRTSGQQLSGLYDAVMSHIDQHHSADARSLRAQTLHGQGLLHQQVDDARAGWVRDWRQVARDFLAHHTVAETTSSDETDAAKPEADSPPSGSMPIADTAPAVTVTRVEDQS